MNINGIPFLTTVSRKIQYCTAEWLPSLDMTAYRSAIEWVFSIYSKAGFTITHIHCNNEYCPLHDKMMNKHGITMNFASAQEHVPGAECNNWVIQECFRATFQQLLHKKLPHIMIKVLTMECAKKLNFPPKGGIL